MTPCDKEPLLTTLQVRQAEIAGDVLHIKTRIDNGMSTTIKRIDDNMTALRPVIEHHASIVKRIEDAGWALSYSFGACLLAMVVWAISKGFNPKI